jgi:hypothetical protein
MPVDDIEEWRVVERDKRYEVSSLGRVRRATAGNKTHAGRILKPSWARPGYFYVRFWIDGRRVKVFVHVLVAEAFVSTRPTPRHEVNHRDAIKTNNHVANLEWTTHHGNMTHAYALGLVPPPPRHGIPPPVRHGEANGHAKLTADDIRFIRRRDHGLSIARLADHFDIALSTVKRIRNRRSWAHVT